MRRIVAVAFTVAVSAAYAQDAAGGQSAFDVTSAKLVPPGLARGVVRAIRTNPGMLSGQTSLRHFTAEAYSIPEVLVLGGAPWLESDVYEISARTETPATPDRLRLMLRNLLAERFGLRVHREAREMHYSALVQGKSGIKPPPMIPGDDRPFGTRGGVLHLRDLADLAKRMSGISGSVVIDQTGLQGIDITIEIETPSAEQLAGFDRRVDARTMVTAIRDSYCASLVRGAEKMGLKVESRNGPVEVLAIDSANRPTEN
jgi:uncharacterized protein (TIGR03435 family)